MNDYSWDNLDRLGVKEVRRLQASTYRINRLVKEGLLDPQRHSGTLFDIFGSN